MTVTPPAAAPRLRRTLGLAACALLALAGARRPAAAQGGVVAGRVLDQEQGSPIPAAAVRVTAEDTHASVAGAADGEGRFSLALPAGKGPFSLRAERLGYLALTVTVSAQDAAGGAVWRDLRLSPQAVALSGVVAGQQRQRQATPGRSPGGREEGRLSWAGMTTPIEPGDLAAAAALQPGVVADEDGISFFGQDPSQARTTLDGATFGATTLPQEALASALVVTSAFDVGRGQYSGGMVEATTLAGTNQFGGALRTRVSPRQLQWQGVAGAPGRPEVSLAHAEGGAGGALAYDRAFWYAAFSASRRTAPLVSLDNAVAAVFSGLGVDPDSASRLASLLREGGVGPAGVALPAASLTGQETGLLRLDWDVSAHHSLMLRLDGRHGDAEGLGVDPLATLASGARSRDWAGGVMVQLSSRLGALSHDFRVYRSTESHRVEPEWAAPAGTVRVAAGGGAAAGSAVLSFGGSRADSETGGSLLELTDEGRLKLGERHELKAGLTWSDRDASFASAGNRNGTFAFNTLADFRAGRAALFTRTLDGGGGRARTRYGALYLGDTWRQGHRLGVTFGVRIEGRGYPSSAAPDPAVRAAFGAAPGRVPGEFGVSPRVGATYHTDRWDVRGGVGEFRGVVALPALAGLLAQVGRADDLYLYCVGPAAPTPEWSAYAADPGAAPEACTGGGGPFAGRAAPLTVFDRGFAAPRTWHAALGASRQLPRVRLNVDASLTRGLSQPAARDANLAAAPAFSLAAEGGRAVYAPAAAIDPGSGGVAPTAGRRLPGWGTVREVGAQGRSTVVQGSARLTWYYPFLGSLLTASYTHTRAWDQVGALPAPGGGAALAGADPAELVQAASDRERRHDLQLQWMVSPRPWVRVGLLGRTLSGAPYTPRVDGDVNGDGTRNDAAFVFDPATAADPQLAAGMAALLDRVPAGVRACLQRQMGHVAARNSCRGGWSSSLDVRGELYPWRRALQRRIQLSFTTGNGLGLADRLLHGAGGLRGWGEPAVADPVLLRVRGFDPAAGAFRYEVNPAFGARDTRFRSPRPFTLTVEARLVVGSDPARQPMQRLVAQGLGAGRSAEELRLAISERVPNLPAQVAALDSALGLGLTDAQRTRLRADAQAQGARLAPLADSLAAVLSDVENRRVADVRAGRRQADALTQRIQRALDEELRAIRQLLTPEQWARLPEAVRVPSRQLVPPRPLRMQ